MPDGMLVITPEEDLTLAGDAFSKDGLAVLFISGSRYGGDLSMAVSLRAGDSPCGRFRILRDAGTSLADPRYPDLAIGAAILWLHGQARARGWRLLSWENLNGTYGPAERPFFALARAVIGSDRFKPLPGVRYADEPGEEES